MVTVTVKTRAPKTVVRQLLIKGKGPRDYAGMNAVLDEWLNGHPAQKTFGAYCKAQEWTLGQVLSLLNYQCCFMLWTDGDGLDAPEFNKLWPIFSHVLKVQDLLTIDVERELYGDVPTPSLTTRAGMLEV